MKNVGGGCLDLYRQFSKSLSFADLNALLVANECAALPAGAAPPPSPAELAQRAAASFLLPHPSGHRSPSEAALLGGYPFTYVNLWTFFWTDASTWRVLTATASAGGNSATVTARPVSLSFDPGDGRPAVSCAGPGRAWAAADADAPPSHGACGYRYTRVSGPGWTHPVTCRQVITWQLSWTGTGNTRGVLGQRVTTTAGVLNVSQVETVTR